MPSCNHEEIVYDPKWAGNRCLACGRLVSDRTWEVWKAEATRRKIADQRGDDADAEANLAARQLAANQVMATVDRQVKAAGL